MRSATGLGTALAALLALLLAAPAPGSDQGRGRARDSYVLSSGPETSISSGSIETLIAVRNRYSGDFLWARRRGRTVVLRDPKVLTQVHAFFEPLRETDPERAAIEKQQRRLDKEEAALDREEEDLDGELDAWSDDGGAESSAGAAARRRLEDRQREIDAARRALESRGRDLEAVESALDAREEELEKRAEAQLWKLVDDAIARGLAEDASD